MKRWWQFSHSSSQLFVKIRFLAIIAGIMLWIATSNAVKVTKYDLSFLHFMLNNFTASYDQKMASKWGFYNFLKFVKDHTPPRALIVHPHPVGPWINLGHELLLQYFLYPRQLEQGPPGEVERSWMLTHTLVAWGEGKTQDKRRYGWPKFPVNVKKFYYMPSKRKFFLDQLGVILGNSGQLLTSSEGLLDNYMSDSEKEIDRHDIIELNGHSREYLELTYTLSTYDYWTKKVNFSLMPETLIQVKVKASVKHSINLMAEVEYGTGKVAIFSSLPNRKIGSWESLSISELYSKAKEYAQLKGWDPRGMRITKVGVNTGLPLPMPYLEKYGVIELERGQERETPDKRIDHFPLFLSLGDFYRVKGNLEEAKVNYELVVKLYSASIWAHYRLGDIYREKNEPVKAIAQYKKTIQLEPDISWFYFALAEVYREQNKTDLAKRYYTKALELDPVNSWAKLALEAISKKG